MQITIDTSQPLNDTERQMLSVLMGVEYVLGEVEEKPAPAKKAAAPAAKKGAAKKAAAAKKDPEPTPEPVAEEPVEEPEAEEPEEAEEEAADDEETPPEELLTLAVKKATDMVANGQASVVREALDAAGANRVRELNEDNVREFFKALS